MSPYSYLARGADGNNLHTEPPKPPSAPLPGSPPRFPQHPLTPVDFGHSGLGFHGHTWLESWATSDSALSSGHEYSTVGAQHILVGPKPSQVVAMCETHKLRRALISHVNTSWMRIHFLFISVALSSRSAFSSQATVVYEVGAQ